MPTPLSGSYSLPKCLIGNTTFVPLASINPAAPCFHPIQQLGVISFHLHQHCTSAYNSTAHDCLLCMIQDRADLHVFIDVREEVDL